MDYLVIATTILIIAGAIIMMLNMKKFRTVTQILKQVSTNEYQNTKWLFRIHESLMVFFITGYLAVAYFVALEIKIVGVLFVGLIFFFGAIFVMIGIITQFRMINSLKNTYNQAISTQKALEESEERYKHFSEVTVEGICFHDNGAILDINQPFVQMFGYEESEIIGKDIINLLIHPDYQKEYFQYIATNYHHPYESFAQKKDGTVFPIETKGRDTQYKEKKVRVMSIRDITERKKGEEKLRQMEKMEGIGTLAGGIAHDFNNILSAIMGYTEMSLSQVADESQIAERLKRVLQASHRAKDLVNQILTFSRKKELELQPVQVSRIVEEALKLLRASIPSTIEFLENIHDNSGIVMADPTQIHQVIMNLCTNASHAMKEEGGVLQVDVECIYLNDDASGIPADLIPGPYVKIMISDTGHGIAPQIMQNIFDPYFTTKEIGIGTGLGLSAVHGIVEQLEGSIEVASEVGRGTTFTIYLRQIEDTIPLKIDTNPRPLNINSRILLVDDEEFVAEVTTEMLKSLGFQVDMRISSIEALAAFQQHPDQFDLVITDQTMPKMTGLKLAEKIRNLRSDIPIIICTGFSEAMYQEKARQVGINGFVMKPIVMKNITDMINNVLDVKSSQRKKN